MLSDIKKSIYLLEALPFEVWVFIFASIVISFAVWWGKQRHLLSKLEACQELRKIKKMPPDYQMTYLRGVDPFVFEEMILTAIKRKGLRIVRNKKYTGDGGIDGRCFINDQEYLIQAKRYSGYINPAHVIEFVNVCKKHNSRGFFVHTGKTGRKSKSVFSNPNIELISGERLLNLLTNNDGK